MASLLVKYDRSAFRVDTMNIYLETGFWPIFLYSEDINITYQSISFSVHLGFRSLHFCERN